MVSMLLAVKKNLMGVTEHTQQGEDVEKMMGVTVKRALLRKL